MPVYIYETTGPRKKRFEVRQSMNDEPLKTHPETGEPVRRVISGGYGLMGLNKRSSSPAPAAAPRGGGCCGGSCGCH